MLDEVHVSLSNWLEEAGCGEVVSSIPVSGGCIASARIIETQSGRSFFLKYQNDLPDDMFEAEAKGLSLLEEKKLIKFPKVYFYNAKHLIMEKINVGKESETFWIRFGEALAKLHTETYDAFGLDHDNYCGLTRQVNKLCENGYEFFAENRLLYQAKLAFEKRRLSTKDLKAVEHLCSRLPDWIPEQPAVLIHGDLWRGNVLCDNEGQVVLIDPACYQGWAEADIAMTRIFGTFDKVFYDSYLEVHPFEAGWLERMPLYNLYHFLNHLNIFGTSYLGHVKDTISRFT